jgi:hypothetical protein
MSEQGRYDRWHQVSQKRLLLRRRALHSSATVAALVAPTAPQCCPLAGWARARAGGAARDRRADALPASQDRRADRVRSQEAAGCAVSSRPRRPEALTVFIQTPDFQGHARAATQGKPRPAAVVSKRRCACPGACSRSAGWSRSSALESPPCSAAARDSRCENSQNRPRNTLTKGTTNFQCACVRACVRAMPACRRSSAWARSTTTVRCRRLLRAPAAERDQHQLPPSTAHPRQCASAVTQVLQRARRVPDRHRRAGRHHPPSSSSRYGHHAALPPSRQCPAGAWGGRGQAAVATHTSAAEDNGIDHNKN